MRFKDMFSTSREDLNMENAVDECASRSISPHQTSVTL
jgi:hypothetical protein